MCTKLADVKVDLKLRNLAHAIVTPDNKQSQMVRATNWSWSQQVKPSL